MRHEFREGDIDRGETFDEFLAKDVLLAETEDAALKEMIADERKVQAKTISEK